MVVLLTEQGILSPRQVCPGCILASDQGLPRFRGGHLSCGSSAAAEVKVTPTDLGRSDAATGQDCPMGFRVVDVPAS